MTGARAVLLPTLAEGYGLPLVEARAAGVRLVASNVLAARESSAGGVTWLDPLDGPGWRDVILALVSNGTKLKGEIEDNNTTLNWAWHMEHAESFLRNI